MAGHGVIPTIRVGDMSAGLAFYVGQLGFTLERGGPADDNSAVARGDARLMLEVAGDLYSRGYNDAIRRRLGTPSAMALYMEAPDLDALYARLEALGVEIVDPLADRPWGQSEFTVADPDGNWLTFWRASEAG
jgi:catechol 2,3-dioxygenase-like lactoylglutathione lyase family enzyme